jgi:hypothetical protein
MVKWTTATYGDAPACATPVTPITGFLGLEETGKAGVVTGHGDAEIGATSACLTGWDHTGAVITSDVTTAMALGALMAKTGLWVKFKDGAGAEKTRKFVSGVSMGSPAQIQYQPAGSSGSVAAFRVPFRVVWVAGATLATAVTST